MTLKMYERRPLPPRSSPTLPLNRSEWVYLACEGPIGQVNQPYILRFDGPLEAETVKRALRRLVSAFPRLRGVLEPTARRYQLRILPDDEQLDVLVDLAFRVEQVDVDDLAVRKRWHEQALNDPLALQRGLALRLQFVPHPERATLLLTVHHILGDGRSMMLCIEALIKLLNGQPIADLPLDDSSMLPAVLPAHWWQWPSKLWASYRANQDEARERARYDIVRLPARRSASYLSCGLMYSRSSFPVKEMSRVAKKMGGSTNSMLMAATATALLELDGNRAGSAALLRMSIDLRRYFPEGSSPQMGNYVAVIDLLVPADVPEQERTAWLDKRVRQGLQRFTDRTLILPLLPYEWLGWLRPHDYSRLLSRAKRLDALPKVSCHTTNIGSVDAFNPEGASIRLRELYPIVAAAFPLLGFLVADGQQMMVGSYHRDEFADEDAQALMTQLHQVLSRWVESTPP